MSALNSTVQSVVCGAAAIAVTLVMSLSVVHATATNPWATPTPRAAGSHSSAWASIEPENAWFGQPSPAVLVD